jgi:hypothetical protein
MFSSANAAVDAATGNLVLSIVKAPGGASLACGEVFLDRSLGFGDYVFVVQTDPSLVSGNGVIVGWTRHVTRYIRRRARECNMVLLVF